MKRTIAVIGGGASGMMAAVTAAEYGAAVTIYESKERLGKKLLAKFPMRENVSAISVGMKQGHYLLDLCYEEDSSADVDMNVIMTESGKFVEIQGTAEEQPFSRDDLNHLLDLAKAGNDRLFEAQRKVLEAYPMPAPDRNSFGSLSDIFSGVKL